jgi:hypothetical protein
MHSVEDLRATRHDLARWIRPTRASPVRAVVRGWAKGASRARRGRGLGIIGGQIGADPLQAPAPVE